MSIIMNIFFIKLTRLRCFLRRDISHFFIYNKFIYNLSAPILTKLKIQTNSHYKKTVNKQVILQKLKDVTQYMTTVVVPTQTKTIKTN